MGWLADSQVMVGHAGFVLGIVAAVMAIILAYAPHGDLTTLTLTLFSISLIVFLISAEKFTEAIDLQNRRRHSLAISLYNLGVVLLLWGMAMLMLLFAYYLPMAVLIAFSSYWVREVLLSLRLQRKKMGRPTAVGQGTTTRPIETPPSG